MSIAKRIGALAAAATQSARSSRTVRCIFDAMPDTVHARGDLSAQRNGNALGTVIARFCSAKECIEAQQDHLVEVPEGAHARRGELARAARFELARDTFNGI